MKNVKSSFRGKISKNAAQKKGGGKNFLKAPDGIPIFVPESGTKVVMDILPYVVTVKNHPDKNGEIAAKGTEWYKFPYKTHGNIGVNRDKVVCPTTFGKRCPICEQGAKKRKEGADEKDLKPYDTSLRNLYFVNIISITDSKKNVKQFKRNIQLFDMADYLFQSVFKEQMDGDDERFEYFPDLEEGASLRVTFTEQTFQGHKYPAATRFLFVDRDKQLGSKFLKEIPSLDDCLIVLEYDELKEKFFETSMDDEEDDDDAPKSKSKRKHKEDDDDDDDDYGESDDDDDDDDEEDEEDEDEDADDEEDDDDDEDDEDDEDEDEDDEEEKPKAKKKSIPAKKSSDTKLKDKCPEGYRFGKDTDKYDECDECDLYKACKKAKANK